ncbi:hypothetical protein NUW58_g2717 [Xylaria curta]|uniref:Uncharacterized protein n=1 Tax=Xylaria curta TaxID=42375 RepID=A0ACC1PFF2_9PEZI|nr:hypothetical protein NUW58_g2717 [Xylaria curta]
MESPCRWYPLPAFPQLPALLVSACFGESSYTVQVTDLATIWVEKLDRRGILLRSLQENTSIDLVDADPEQWAVFLSKLKAALDPASSDHHLTSLSIAASDHSKNQGGLTLRITCELPKPLDALKWHVHLAKCQPVSLTSELVLPLIQEHYVRSREVGGLVNQLKEKDALIKKLLDKLSTMHTPLELIFNSLSAKHATTRAAAEERIKGLAPFDEAKWRSQLGREAPQNTPSLLRSVFSDSGFSYITGLDLGISDTLNDWWANLGPEFRASSELESSTSRQEPKEKAHGDKLLSGNIENDDFQVQAPLAPTSPIGGKTVGGKVIHEADESDVSDISDGNPMPSRNNLHSRIGTLGGAKAPQDHSTSQSSRTLHADEDDTASESEVEDHSTPLRHIEQPKPSLNTSGKSRKLSQPIETAIATNSLVEANDETASGSDSGDDNPPELQTSSARGPMTPRKGALGRIGGKSKDTVSSSPPPKISTLNTAGESASPKKPEVRKIGAIGKKPPHIEPKRPHSSTPAEPEESETEEQKAERKRAELAKELDKKSALPARKKRKF